MSSKALHQRASGRILVTRSASRRKALIGPAKYADLHPIPDPNYVSAPRTANWNIVRSIDSSVAPPEVISAYNDFSAVNRPRMLAEEPTKVDYSSATM